MVFAIGTKVKLLHTGDLAVVTHWLDGGMIQVRIMGDDMEIPVFPEDIVRVDEAQPTVKAKVVQGKQEQRAPEPPQRPKVELQYAILKSQGVQLAFDPIFRHDGSTEKYAIYLINDWRYDVLYDYELSLETGILKTDNGKLAALTALKIGELQYDELNEAPIFDIECRLITTAGASEPMRKSLKIKPKSFFTKLRMAPLLNRQTHLFKLFDSLPTGDETSRPAEDLAAYTKRNVLPTTQWLNSEEQRHEVAELAAFQSEIDLHIEKLAANWEKLNNAEILALQVEQFEKYIDRAIRMGVDRVFVIHGVGAGRLRNAIATRLMQMPEVKTFKNEYHPRYGYGATEVIFA